MLSVGHCLLSRLWFMYLEDSEGNRAASEILVTSIYWTFIPFTQCVREWYLIPSILYKAGAVMIPFLGWGNQDPKKRSQEPMAVAFFSEGVRTCSQGSTLSLWASAALTNYGMSLGDGSLGRTVLWKKKWIVLLPKPVNECLEKMSVTVRFSARQMRVNLFWLLAYFVA